MGYESRLYIVDKTRISENVNGKEMFFCEKIATFNLSVVPDVSKKLLSYNDTNGYVYADNGDLLAEDMYGKPLKEIPVNDVIKILEDAYAHCDYRRFMPCLQLLKGFDLSRWGNLVVLHYGY